MSNIVRTAKGAKLDMSALKLKNEHTVPVGNKTQVKEKVLNTAEKKNVDSPRKLHTNVPVNKPVSKNETVAVVTIAAKPIKKK